MSRLKLNLSCIAFCLLLCTPLQSQDETIPSHGWQKAGLPYIQNFSPRDYKADPQNWKIAQDERGMLSGDRVLAIATDSNRTSSVLSQVVTVP